MERTMTSRQALERLQDLAIRDMGGTRGDRIHMLRRRQWDIEEWMKPGYLLTKLTAEEREALKDLKADDIAKVILRPELSWY